MLYANRASFLEPRRVVEPFAWAGHIPFAFWLVEALKPKLVVELGTHTGNSFCAVAQALEAFAPSGKVYAVDHWKGDDHAGSYSEDVYTELKSYTANLYPDMAVMLRASFDEAISQFDNVSIDLLHIDGMHTYEAVKHDFESWLPKLSAKGVVIIHDSAVTVRDFGVGAFVRELASKHSVFEFDHSHGLAVVAPNSIPEPLRQFFGDQVDDVGLKAGEVFPRLGKGVLASAHADRFARASDLALGQTDRARMLSDIQDKLEVVIAATGREFALADSYRSPFVNTGQIQEMLVREMLSSGYLSPCFYKTQINGTGVESDTEICLHYLRYGEAQGLAPSAKFDPAHYANANPDVVSSKFGLLEHFLLFGQREGRSPLAQAEVTSSG